MNRRSRLFGGTALCVAALSAGALIAQNLPNAGAGATRPVLLPPSSYGANDPLFREPYIDIDEWRDTPVRHHYMHGGFKGTDLRFSFYFPDQAQYQGRFFQHLAAATPKTDDSASQGKGENNRIAFAFESGGYLVESNMGGTTGRSDATIGGFRASGAAADYSRVIAMKLFGGKRPYGYVYGGSGGAYRTIGAIENSTVWDGAVPYVPGSTNPTGVVATGHERVGRLLRGKLPQILDAIDAGGSGNPYAGLNKDEQDALREMLRFAVPPQIFSAERPDLAIGSSAGIAADPTYVTDFWTKPGYEGADPNSYASRARVQHKTTVARLLTADEATQRGLSAMVGQGGPFVNPVGSADANGRPAAPAQGASQLGPAVAAIEIAGDPGKDLNGAVLIVKTGAAAGKTIPIGRHAGTVVAPGASVAMDPRAAAFGGGAGAIDAAFRNLSLLKPGDEVELDNSASLAADVYNRYAVPKGDFLPWAQYLDARGTPIHPQRERPAQGGGVGVGGSIPNGKFRVKAIMVASLGDELAAPWNADWYARRVKEHWGARFNDNFRLWYTDRAMHGDSAAPNAARQTVAYLGVLHQALRDVAAWVERGVPPPSSTSYRFVDGQIVLPQTAAARGGIQPVVSLIANGKARADVAPGQTVTLTGTIEVPPRTGKVVLAEWDLDGSGTFAVPGTLKMVSPTLATVTTKYAFSTPGTYFPVLRATSQREGKADTPFGRIRNLARARVVVK